MTKPARFLLPAALLLVALAPPAAAQESVCTPHFVVSYECVGTRDGCGVWADGLVGTCTPECITVECADPHFCQEPARLCGLDAPVCVEGEQLFGDQGSCALADAGTEACPGHPGYSRAYVHVLGRGPSAGCVPDLG